MATRVNAPPRSHTDHVSAIGAERHPQADFVAAACHGIRRDTVETDCGEDKCNDAEKAGKAGDGALLVEGPSHLFFQRANVDHGQVGIRRGERARDEGLQYARRSVGDQQNAADVVRGGLHPLHQRARVLHGLRQRDEESRTRRLIELKARELGVADDPHDAKRVDVLGEVQPEAAIDRILSGRKEAPHERFVHHGDVLGSLVVALCEVASANELDAQILEVARADAVPR